MDKEQGSSLAESRERIWEHTAFCWKELLDRAFAGFGPTDQALERIIDRMERGS